MAKAVENIQAETVISFLLTEVVQNFGVPEQIITDRGSNFLAEITLKFYKNLDIIHTPTTTYRQQANGQVERLNQTLKRTLAKICIENIENWDCYIWKSLLAIRSMKNKSTGLSPAKLLYGVELTLPSSWKGPESEVNIGKAIEELLSYINTGLEELRNSGYERNIISKNNSAAIYDAKVVKHQFKLGDKVLRHSDVLKYKFSATWEGPFTITRLGNKGAYTIMDSSGNFDIVHGDKLKIYRESNRMIPEVSSSTLNSTLKKFREVNNIQLEGLPKGRRLLHIPK
ncbi:Pol polyprotein [Smittium culicis]|uniref:Pol polyprotein n=1 Tax=Smittium culicis TaxID=133412 RepID=A0A1R1Y2N7_9FUNG|nr:Pol polyprotein [Smittium culicis]